MEMDKDDPRTVLVVDDEPHVVAYLEMVLQDQGYTTVSAANGREGIEKAKAHSPDLICLDITMPEESGVRMYKNLKDDPDLGHIPVIVVTAKDLSEDDRRILSGRVEQIVEKGACSHEHLLELIRKVVPAEHRAAG